ncbi:diaminopimelate epimerase [Marixanthomonas spongiae]|uniref:Diaminopimelate epimerase n=1 Tax=Marixanthomonas spongiae TaxID=2174845 RepID=A0A2U0I5X0_9FLAO|nr:diaminopimelate epimerase [Marixanthomonas spongiae]PVW16511.1 diaminopimelate epimerase [Marixanthomonas spongiae]
MKFQFYKYQGTGNDFVLIDNRHDTFCKNDTKLIAQLCSRKFGIGADGLILLENHPEADFKMVYYNADGNESSMCGNGGRCIAHFANHLGIVEKTAEFEAIDGRHTAEIEAGMVSLKMSDVSEIEMNRNHLFLNTGSPHHVQLVETVSAFDVFSEGRKLRNELYGKEGANINFVQQISENTFSVRTYERGVEDETLSCGTGVTAVAIAMHKKGLTKHSTVHLNTPGGTLTVTFEKIENRYTNVQLQGPATLVFKGEWL